MDTGRLPEIIFDKDGSQRPRRVSWPVHYSFDNKYYATGEKRAVPEFGNAGVRLLFNRMAPGHN